MHKPYACSFYVGNVRTAQADRNVAQVLAQVRMQHLGRRKQFYQSRAPAKQFLISRIFEVACGNGWTGMQQFRGNAAGRSIWKCTVLVDATQQSRHIRTYWYGLFNWPKNIKLQVNGKLSIVGQHVHHPLMYSSSFRRYRLHDPALRSPTSPRRLLMNTSLCVATYFLRRLQALPTCKPRGARGSHATRCSP